jgi:serine/threonine protein phosphatase PrpC
MTNKELLKLPGYIKAKDGSTALVVLVSGTEPPGAGKPGNTRVYVANVGDCRCLSLAAH